MSPQTARRWADAGRLPMGRYGSGNRVIDGVGLSRFVRERTAEEGPFHPVSPAFAYALRDAGVA
ncbi:hypothetical protein [Streptomyces sp. uw30]|uniref:hypothetical protein n=1 Tax=Streptomyces sp. uw30 TaxID=1828179 RepID=UPI0039675B00